MPKATPNLAKKFGVLVLLSAQASCHFMDTTKSSVQTSGSGSSSAAQEEARACDRASDFKALPNDCLVKIMNCIDGDIGGVCSISPSTLTAFKDWANENKKTLFPPDVVKINAEKSADHWAKLYSAYRNLISGNSTPQFIATVTDVTKQPSVTELGTDLVAFYKHKDNAYSLQITKDFKQLEQQVTVSAPLGIVARGSSNYGYLEQQNNTLTLIEDTIPGAACGPKQQHVIGNIRFSSDVPVRMYGNTLVWSEDGRWSKKVAVPPALDTNVSKMIRHGDGVFAVTAAEANTIDKGLIAAFMAADQNEKSILIQLLGQGLRISDLIDIRPLKNGDTLITIPLDRADLNPGNSNFFLLKQGTTVPVALPRLKGGSSFGLSMVELFDGTVAILQTPSKSGSNSYNNIYFLSKDRQKLYKMRPRNIEPPVDFVKLYRMHSKIGILSKKRSPPHTYQLHVLDPYALNN